MLGQIQSTLKLHLNSITGFSSNKRIVVIESDDWGSIRMPDKSTFLHAEKAGIPVSKCPYLSNDTLASALDWEVLLTQTATIKDSSNRIMPITGNVVVGNPNMEKIKQANFESYYWEPFTDTLKRFNHSQNSFKYWEIAMNVGAFVPEFHGREHVNVQLWLKLLKAQHPLVTSAFEFGFWGLGSNILSDQRHFMQASFDYLDHSAVPFLKQALQEGLESFHSILNKPAQSFIPNNFIFPPELLSTLAKNGVNTIQGRLRTHAPLGTADKRMLVKKKMGEINEFGQVFLNRNVFLEPAQAKNKHQLLKKAIKELDVAFLWKKPAIISIHRLNFIGSIQEQNRLENWSIIQKFFQYVKKRYPDFVFMSSSELSSFMAKQHG